MNDKSKQFEELAKPLMKWLNENCHPHTTIIIEQTSAEVLEGAMAFTTEEFLVD